LDKRTLVAEKLPVPPLHWTAKVSCRFSEWTTLVFLFQWLIRLLWDWLPFPLLRFLGQFSEPMPWPWPLLPLLPQLSFVLVLFIFGGIALALSFRRQWRKGLGIAIVGVALPGIILTFYAAFYVSMVSCCLR
jgi:hypothetical protein